LDSLSHGHRIGRIAWQFTVVRTCPRGGRCAGGNRVRCFAPPCLTTPSLYRGTVPGVCRPGLARRPANRSRNPRHRDAGDLRDQQARHRVRETDRRRLG
jgi:hypothetical protein